jgi:hypothetical protein
MVPQSGELLDSQLEHEIRRKSVQIPFHGPDQGLGLDSIQQREVGIEHDVLPAQPQDGRPNPFNGHDFA